MIRVLCVDDNLDLAEVLEATIRAEPDMESVGVLTSADHLPEEVEQRKPDVILLDLTMPGRDPLDAVGEIARRTPESRAVIVSGYDDPNSIDNAIKRGAWGYVSKHAEFDRLLLAVRTVASGEPFIDAL